MKIACLVTCFALTLLSGAIAQNNKFDSSNPFYAPSTLPLQAPAFDKIKNEHFKPAIEEGMKQQMEEIQKIANNSAAPTFANTLVELEKSGRLLSRVNAVLSVYTGAHTNPDLQKLEEEMAPKLSANRDALYLNTKLFKRIEEVYKKRDQLKLDAESKRLVEVYYQNFLLAGAQLSDGDKEVLKKLNQEEASLRTKFSKQVLMGSKAGVIIDTRAELAGLSENAINAAAQNARAAGAEGKFLFPLQNTTGQPEMQLLTNRETRKKFFEASWNRTEKGDANDTRPTITRIAQIRAQKAKLMGNTTFAEWKLQNQMAKTPATVESFLSGLTAGAVEKAKREIAEVQAVIDQQNGGFQLEAWDWSFYSEQLRKAKFDLDENQTKPYFEINTVLEKGVFYAANIMYGLTFKQRTDLPVYHPDVKVYDVYDKDGSLLAIFYCDYYKRDSKRGGAWMSSMVGQSKLLGTKPVIYNVCNFPKPAPGEPELVTSGNMRTMFHEFGHALHGMFADQQYPTLSGTGTARDFVEFPSQFNAHWATDPKIINNYAKHYKTGEVIPQELLAKMEKAGGFSRGYSLIETLQADNIDMQWHTLSADAPLQDADKFEADALKKTGLDVPQIRSRYRSTYFAHIWGSGYSAGYYAYLWTEMLAYDTYAWCKANGGMTRENGQRYRDMVLSRGNSIELGKMFRDYRGQDPDIKPMLGNMGLVVK